MCSTPKVFCRGNKPQNWACWVSCFFNSASMQYLIVTYEYKAQENKLACFCSTTCTRCHRFRCSNWIQKEKPHLKPSRSVWRWWLWTCTASPRREGPHRNTGRLNKSSGARIDRSLRLVTRGVWRWWMGRCKPAASRLRAIVVARSCFARRHRLDREAVQNEASEKVPVLRGSTAPPRWISWLCNTSQERPNVGDGQPHLCKSTQA